MNVMLQHQGWYYGFIPLFPLLPDTLQAFNLQKVFSTGITNRLTKKIYNIISNNSKQP